jgi:hypothetical protein
MISDRELTAHLVLDGEPLGCFSRQALTLGSGPDEGHPAGLSLHQKLSLVPVVVGPAHGAGREWSVCGHGIQSLS